MRGQEDEIEERGAITRKPFTTKDTKEHKGRSGDRKSNTYHRVTETRRKVGDRVIEIGCSQQRNN